MIEGISQRGFDQLLSLGGGQTLLGLALELGVGDEDADQAPGLGDHILSRQQARPLLADQLGVGLEPAGQGGPEAGLVGPALGGGHCVAVGLEKAVRLTEAGACPGDGPFDLARIALALVATCEGLRRERLNAVHPLGEVVGEAVGEPQDGLGGGLVLDPGGIAGPANLDASEQVGLGARHPVEAGRTEDGGVAEDHGIGPEGNDRAMPAGGSQLLKRADGLATAEGLAPLETVLEGGHLQVLGQGVDHGDADPVQAAGGLIGLAREFPARMQDGHDDLEGGLARMLGMRIHGNAAAVVPDRQSAVGVQTHLDDPGVTGDGLVHGVVQDLGEEMVQGALVRAADVHARSFPDGLQALEDLDILGGVSPAFCGGCCRRRSRDGLRRRLRETGRPRLGLRIVEERGLGRGPGHVPRLPRFGVARRARKRAAGSFRRPPRASATDRWRQHL